MNTDVVMAFIEHVKGLTSPVNILLVDDNPHDLIAVSHLLSKCGDKLFIHEAENGVQALEKMRNQPFNLVLLDVRMPGMDGVSVMKAMVAENIRYPVALMTGLHNGPLVEQCLKIGAFIHIQKPVTIEHLREIFKLLKI